MHSSCPLHPSHVVCHVVLPSPPHPSHVVCHVVFPHGVLVKAVRDVLQFLLLQTTNETACLHVSQWGGERERANARTNSTYVHILLSMETLCKSDLHVLLQGFLFVSQFTMRVSDQTWEGESGRVWVLTAHVQ